MLNKEDAENIPQDVFIEVYQSIQSFRGDAKISTWIYRITVTKCLDEIKKRNRRKRLASITKMLHIDDVTNWISGGSMPDKSLHENEKMQEVAFLRNTKP